MIARLLLVCSAIALAAPLARPAQADNFSQKPIGRLLVIDANTYVFAAPPGGLRSLARTVDAPNLKEKTLRYQGHIEKMAVLRETGFFDKREINVKGARIRPIDLTAALLFPKWKLGEGEADITALQVMVEGRKDGELAKRVFNLLDKYDPETGVHSMARTTGYTATAAVRKGPPW